MFLCAEILTGRYEDDFEDCELSDEDEAFEDQEEEEEEEERGVGV